MTQFLKTTRGGLINANFIARIKPDDACKWMTIATLKDETTATINARIEDIEKQFLPVIPATPGYFHLAYFTEWEAEGGHGVKRMPIIAWRIENGIAEPICLDDTDSQATNLVGSGILSPDGQVAWPYMGRYENEEAWRRDMAEEATRLAVSKNATKGSKAATQIATCDPSSTSA